MTEETQAAAPAKPPKDVRNDVVRPAPGGLIAKVWEIADKLSEHHNRPATRSEVREAIGDSVNPATVATQYARWTKFYGVSDVIKAHRKAQTQAKAAAGDEAKAAAKADREAKAQAKAAGDEAKAAAEKEKADAKAAADAEKQRAREAADAAKAEAKAKAQDKRDAAAKAKADKASAKAAGGAGQQAAA